jgi:outer membrane lipoprotein SlyB
MKKTFVFVFLLTFSMTSCQNNNGNSKATYTIVSPTVVRPNTDFLVAVSVFNIGIQDRKSLFDIYLIDTFN